MDVLQFKDYSSIQVENSFPTQHLILPYFFIYPFLS